MPAALAAAARAAIKPVTRRQMVRALHQLGLRDEILAFVAAAPAEIQIDFAETTEFARDYPAIEVYRQAVGKTPEEVDAVWALAASL